ncbi:MAG: S-layer homology domain-containing protein [Peptococcia bacterium]
MAEEHSLTEPGSFSDIGGHWAEKEIKAWTARELAGGYPDGTFRPDSPITRAEFVTLVNRAFDSSKMLGMDEMAISQTSGTAGFRDVAATDWYAPEFAKAVAIGYLSGYPDGTVKPQNLLTRQEAAVLLARIMPSAGLAKDNIFVDQAQIPEWSEAAIAAAANGGYMKGYPDGTFQPARPITRAEAISLLDRAVGTLSNHNRPLDDGQYTQSKKKKSNDVSLSDLTINGITVPGFAIDVLSYELVLPYGTTDADLPQVAGVAATAHHAKARVTVTQAVGLMAPDNIATVLVTAENGRTQVYTVLFTVAPNTATSLSEFTIGGEDILALPGVLTAAGAFLPVADFTDFEGIVVESTDPHAAVTVTLDGTLIAEEALATQVITANNVIIVTVVAEDGVTTGNYKVTAVQAYCVTYDGNGSTSGSVPTDGNAYQGGDTVTLSENVGALSKTNYIFAGWQTAQDGSGTTYEAGDTFELGEANVTLYARWVIDNNFTNESRTGTTATFTWTAAEGADSVQIRQSADGGQTWEDATHAALLPTAETVVVTGLSTGTDYRFKLLVTGGATPGESRTIEVTTEEELVFGASWNSSTGGTTMTRLGDAVGANGKTTPAQIGKYFDDFAPWSGMRLCTVSDGGVITSYLDEFANPDDFDRSGGAGQVMVQIPKFYYKHTYENGVHEFWVADSSAEGYILHPAFMRAGSERDFLLVGAYKASLGKAEDNVTDTIASRTGTFPEVSKTLKEFRDYATARGDNWTQIDALTRNAIALLYLVEYANTDSENAIGRGVVIASEPVACGGCNYLNGASGNAAGDVGKRSVSYRGMEDLWGNYWEFIDGINIRDYCPYVADNSFKSNEFEGEYQELSVSLPNADGYITDFIFSPKEEENWFLLPSTVDSNDKTRIPDYYYQSSGERIVLAGGRWSSGGTAGMFSYTINAVSTSKNDYSTARILFIPESELEK